jgi:hypothetical protein
MNAIKSTQHVVMRFADSLCSGVDTIREHQQVIDQKGVVWLGKIGRPLAQHNLDILNGQIQSRKRTFLFLVQKRGREYIWTKALLSEVSRSVPALVRSPVPAYYQELGITKLVSMWFKVENLRKATRAEIRNLHVVSSRRQISETLSSSMAAIFMVCIGCSTSNGGSKRNGSPRTFNIHEAILDVFEEEDDDF